MWSIEIWICFRWREKCVDMLQMEKCQKQERDDPGTGGEAPVFADKQLMEELIYNLCDNAIRYNKKDGTVTVTTGIENGHTFPFREGHRNRYLCGTSGAGI